MTRRLEQDLHRACAKFLDLALPPDAIWCHYPAGGKRSPIEARVFKSFLEPRIPLRAHLGGRA